MNKVQRSMLLGAAALVAPLAVMHCNTHGDSPDLGSFNHPDAAVMATASGSSSGGTSDDSGSGDDAETTGDSGGSGSDGSGDGSAGDAAHATGDAATDAGDASEEPPSCQTPDGGVACTPGKVACGSTSCIASSQFCCATPSSSSGTCVASSGSCTGGANEVQCEEAADCPTGNVCCQQMLLSIGPSPTQCQTSCMTGWFQICRSASECGSSTACVPQTCAVGLGGSYSLEACAVPPPIISVGTPTGAMQGCTAN